MELKMKAPLQQLAVVEQPKTKKKPVIPAKAGIQFFKSVSGASCLFQQQF